jgi:hypothetical protein
MTKKWSPLYAEYKRRKRLRQRFGLKVSEYEAMIASQDGVCAICKSPESTVHDTAKGAAVRRLSVDHCHNTGAVRGLLCRACNKGLGHFRDDPSLLRAAANYLESGPRMP